MAALKRRFALLALAVLAAIVAGAGVRIVPADGVGLVDSALGRGRVLAPGVHWVVPLAESVGVHAPYRHEGPLGLVSPEGSRVEMRLAFEMRLDPDGARKLIAAGSGERAVERLSSAFDDAVLGVVAERREGLLPDLGGAIGAAVDEELSRYGTLAGAATLEYVEESTAVTAMRAEEARRMIAAASHDTGQKILVVGLDGADWQIAGPLIDRGLLPTLDSLRRRGAWGNLKSLTPVLSPLLWTSVATGVTADRHGILDFLVRDPATGAKVPVSSRFRKVRALWNQFSDAGRTADIVAWWATWPAEPIRGHLISDRVSYSLFDFDLPSGDVGATHPPEYFALVRPELVTDESITYEDVAHFAEITPDEFAAARAKIAADRSSAYRDPINHLTKILAATRNYHRIGLRLIGEGQADLTAVYYQGIDEVGHRFMHYTSPPLPGIDPADVARYGEVIERFYVWQDQLLAELLEAADPSTTVIVLSDHGFLNGPDRPPGETADIEGKPGKWHRLYGILVMAGPPIRSLELDTTSLLDISPTVLRLAGLPVPDDTEGRVIEEALHAEFRERYPTTTIPTYEVTPFRDRVATPSAAVAAVEQEMLENLRSLGYVGDVDLAAPANGTATAADIDPDSAGTPTGHLNLAAVLLQDGRLEEAEHEIEAALKLAPGFAAARQMLFDVRMRQQRYDEAIAIAEDLFGSKGGFDEHFLTRVAQGYRLAGRTDEAIERFRRAIGAGRLEFGVPMARLLFERGDLDDADDAARVVLAREPLNESAMATAVRVAQARADFRTVEPLLARALEVNERSVMHLVWTAVARESRGDVAEAERLLKRALEVDPDHGAAMANLGAFYGRHGRANDALPLLERALRIMPGNVEARVNLGTALARLGRLREAIPAFERAVEDGHQSTAVCNALARAYHETGDLATAQEWLRRSLEIDPNQPRVRELLK